MPLTTVSGDPLLTSAQTLAFGINAQGRAELDALSAALHDRYPVAFAAFRRQARRGRISAGQLWPWNDARPRLLFMVVRETPVGMTRVRYVESAAMTLARDYRLYGVTSVAVAQLGTAQEWPLLAAVLDRWFAPSALPVTVYESYAPGVPAHTTLFDQFND